MRFSNFVVAALSAPLCVDGNRKDEPVEETNVASLEGMHFGDGEVHLSMDDAMMALLSFWHDDGDRVPIDLDAWTQATELRNPENEIRDASHVEEDDDVEEDFAVDIGVLSMERKLFPECTSNPVVNETGELRSVRGLVSNCYSNSPSLEDCPDEYSVGLHCWNTSMITDLSYAFYGLTYFNDDISSWDTGKVTSMTAAFFGASSFNSDISSWDTGNVTSLALTFLGTSSFDSDISSWDTGKVTSLLGSFAGAFTFNSDLSSWDIGNVKDLAGTFSGASSFNSDISPWETGNVTTLRETFAGASKFNVDISSWDIGKVTSTKGMFFNAANFSQCLDSWAAKTPDTVSTDSMLTGSACPIQSDPDPKKGPWCQGFEERCFGACTDADEFRFGKNKMRSCKFIRELTARTKERLKQRLERICKRKVFPGEKSKTGKRIRVRDVCREACGTRGFGPGRKCNFVSV